MPVRLNVGVVDEMVGHLATNTFYQCYLNLFDGTMPPDASYGDVAYTKLVEITLGGDVGQPLSLTFLSDGTIQMTPGEDWKGVALAAGTVGWGRLYGTSVVTGASTAAIRIDMNAATSGAPITMANTTIALGATVTIDTCTITMPKE